jgi:Ca2+-binding RTX toxin-like protein
MISLGGGSDVGYGGACGPVSPPEKDTASWWRVADRDLRHAGEDDSSAPAKSAGNDDDRLVGGKGEDALFGGLGNDRVVGGSGRDLLSGGSGADRLVGGPGRNSYKGGSGNDSINAANGVREQVDCGFGRDRVTADPRDRLTGCERVTRVRKRAKKDLPQLLPECPGGGHECHSGETVVLSKARR